MLADDLHLRFDDVMAKAAEVGEVYGRSSEKRDQESRTLLTRCTTNISRLIARQRVAQWWAEYADIAETA